MRLQIYEQVVERVGFVMTRNPTCSAIPIILGINVLKDLNILHLLAKTEQLGKLAQGCGL